MSRSPLDVVQVNAIGLPDESQQFDFNFRNWTSFCLKNSIVAPSEASFEIGDDTSYGRLSHLCQLGAEFVVMVDDRARMVGRVEAISGPSDARQSTVQSFVIRTRMSDAAYASAPQGLQLKRASIKQFVLACYAGIGLEEKHFDFRGDVSRNLMTGVSTKSPREHRPIEAITTEQAKVNPPETIFTAVDRHLRRHGMMHWDSGDGRIVVAAPDDTQEPVAHLLCRRHPNGQYNNVLSVQRDQDVSQSPTELGIFGVGGGVTFSKSRVSDIVYNEALKRRGFRRSVVIVDEAVKTKQLAGARANREFAMRNRGLDALQITVDGLSFREGSALLPWSPDTTHDVFLEQLGGSLGVYYLESVEMTRNVGVADQSKLTLVKQGVWVL
jgi:prophage tail gpP-like protein